MKTLEKKTTKGAKSAKDTQKKTTEGTGGAENLALSADAGTASTETPVRRGKLREYARDFLPAFNLSLIAEDSKNARQTFDDQRQRELMDSLADKGLQQPLWVRQLKEPDKNGCTHVLIAGARRTRAAKAIGLLTVPVFDYGKLLDEEAEELADVENCQRVDLTDAERALHYAAMVEKHGWQWWDEADPSRSLAHRFNLGSKSVAYEWARLARLPKLALEALAKGELRSRSVAVKLASIGDPEALKRALAEAINDRWTDDEADRFIAERYLAELKGAPFALDDAELLPAAGPCTTCPWRSGNQMDLAPQFRRRGDICTKPSCLREKLQADFTRRAKEHEKAGGKVWGAKEAEQNGLRKDWSSLGGKWLDLSDSGYVWQLSTQIGKKSLKDALAPKLKDGSLKVIMAFDPHRGRLREIVEVDAAKAAARALGVIKKEKSTGPSDAEKKQAEKTKRAGRIVELQVQAIVDAATAKAANCKGGPDPWTMLALGHVSRLLDADKCRRIAKRRNLDKSHFKLQSHGVWQREAVQKCIEELPSKTASDTAEVAGGIAELIATPTYLHWDHPEKLDEGNLVALLDHLGMKYKVVLDIAKRKEAEEWSAKLKPAKKAPSLADDADAKKIKKLLPQALKLRAQWKKKTGNDATASMLLKAYKITQALAWKLQDAAIEAEGGAK